MRGTPTMALIDAQGHIRHQHFGQIDDALLSMQIASLIIETLAMPGLTDQASVDLGFDTDDRRLEFVSA